MDPLKSPHFSLILQTSPYFCWREKSLLPKFLSWFNPCMWQTLCHVTNSMLCENLYTMWQPLCHVTTSMPRYSLYALWHTFISHITIENTMKIHKSVTQKKCKETQNFQTCALDYLNTQVDLKHLKNILHICPKRYSIK